MNFLKKLVMIVFFLVQVKPANSAGGESEGYVIKTLWGTYYDRVRSSAQGKVLFSKEITSAGIFHNEKWNLVRWLFEK